MAAQQMERQMTYYVIDSDENLTSYSADAEAAESFTSARSARKRAKELAQNEPGKRFYIAHVVASVHCPVGDPVEVEE